MIEIIEAIDSNDEHDGGEHGTTAPSVGLSFGYSLDAAGDVMSRKAHEPASSTPSAQSSSATSTQSATPEHLAAWEQPDAETRDEDEGHTSSPKKRRGGRRNS